MSEKAGELYVSIQVDTEALEQGFTTAQRLGQAAAGTMENAWTNQAAKGMERFTEAVADATANLTIYNQTIAGNSLNTFTTSVQGAETILNDISKELGTYTVETTSAKEASQQADEAA